MTRRGPIACCLAALVLLAITGPGCSDHQSSDTSASNPSSDGESALERPLDLPSVDLDFRRGVPGECFSGKRTEAGAMHLRGIPGEGALTRATKVRSAAAFMRLTNGPPRITYWDGARAVPGADERAVQAFWITPENYDGPLLVRGGRIDRPGSLGFGKSATPESQLQLPPGHRRPWGARGNLLPPGWRAAYVPIRVERPGCYAVQIDGSDFTYDITFAVARG